MLQVALGVGLFVVGLLVMVLLFGTVILPAIYIVPRTTLWLVRGWEKWLRFFVQRNEVG